MLWDDALLSPPFPSRHPCNRSHAPIKDERLKEKTNCEEETNCSNTSNKLVSRHEKKHKHWQSLTRRFNGSMKRPTYLSSFREHKNASKHKAISDCTHYLPQLANFIQCPHGCFATVHWRHSYSKVWPPLPGHLDLGAALLPAGKSFPNFLNRHLLGSAGKTISSSQHI